MGPGGRVGGVARRVQRVVPKATGFGLERAQVGDDGVRDDDLRPQLRDQGIDDGVRHGGKPSDGAKAASAVDGSVRGRSG